MCHDKNQPIFYLLNCVSCLCAFQMEKVQRTGVQLSERLASLGIMGTHHSNMALNWAPSLAASQFLPYYAEKHEPLWQLMYIFRCFFEGCEGLLWGFPLSAAQQCSFIKPLLNNTTLQSPFNNPKCGPGSHHKKKLLRRCTIYHAHREVFSESCLSKPNLECNYIFKLI